MAGLGVVNHHVFVDVTTAVNLWRRVNHHLSSCHLYGINTAGELQEGVSDKCV